MATNEKYTNRMFLNDVINGANADAVKAFATAELAKLDARNEARKGKESKTAKDNAPIKEDIKAFVKDNPGATAEAIGKAIGQTTAKVSALATQLVKNEVLVAAEVKKVGGKGKVKAYTLA